MVFTRRTKNGAHENQHLHSKSIRVKVFLIICHNCLGFLASWAKTVFLLLIGYLPVKPEARANYSYPLLKTDLWRVRNGWNRAVITHLPRTFFSEAEDYSWLPTAEDIAMSLSWEEGHIPLFFFFCLQKMFDPIPGHWKVRGWVDEGELASPLWLDMAGLTHLPFLWRLLFCTCGCPTEPFPRCLKTT